MLGLCAFPSEDFVFFFGRAGWEGTTQERRGTVGYFRSSNYGWYILTDYSL
jgi:hypothetical protein